MDLFNYLPSLWFGPKQYAGTHFWELPAILQGTRRKTADFTGTSRENSPGTSLATHPPLRRPRHRHLRPRPVPPLVPLSFRLYCEIIPDPFPRHSLAACPPRVRYRTPLEPRCRLGTRRSAHRNSRRLELRRRPPFQRGPPPLVDRRHPLVVALPFHLHQPLSLVDDHPRNLSCFHVLHRRPPLRPTRTSLDRSDRVRHPDHRLV